ncbi:MAG: hypothetical protein RL333_1772 [Pseudomonadota bacterium]|jgi:outer membrane protein assembly factor BamB
MRFLAPLLALSLLGGCAQINAFKDLAGAITDTIRGSDNAEPPKELQPLEPTVNMTVLWSNQIGKGSLGRILNLMPAVTGTTVYAADHKGLIVAVDRANGDTQWSKETGLEVASGPVVAGDKLLFGTSNAELVAISLADGALLWKTALTSEMMSLPRVSHNIVVARTSDGRIAGFDLGHGGIKWSHERTLPPLSIRSQGSPTIHGDLVLDGFGAGKLTALNVQDGHLVWEVTAVVPRGRSEVERMVELDAEPMVQGDVAYATGFQGGLTAVDITNGSILWHQKTAYSSHATALSRKSLFITDTSSDIWSMDITNGADQWKQDILHQRRLTVPARVKDYLVVGDFEGYLHLLRADNGSLVGRLDLSSDDPIVATPLVYDDVLYVLTSEGHLAAIRVD